MADNGHGTLRYEDCHGSAGERRASAASYLSTNSTASADLSIASHGSSLLYNAHLAAPAMIRAGSSDTAMSTRPSSIASSYGHELVYGKRHQPSSIRALGAASHGKGSLRDAAAISTVSAP